MMKYGKLKGLYKSNQLESIDINTLPIWIRAYLNISDNEFGSEVIKTLIVKKPECITYALSRRIEAVFGVLYETLISYYLAPKNYYHSPEELYYEIYFDYNQLDFDEHREFIFVSEIFQSGIFFDSLEAFVAAVRYCIPNEIRIKQAQPLQIWRCRKLGKSFPFLGDSTELMFRISYEQYGIETQGDITTELWNLFKVTALVLYAVIKDKMYVVYDGADGLEVYIQGPYIDNIRNLLKIDKNLCIPVLDNVPLEYKKIPDWNLVEPVTHIRHPTSLNYKTGRVCLLMTSAIFDMQLEDIPSIRTLFS